MQGEEMTRLLTIAIPLLGPFLVWGLLYAVARRSPTRINTLLTWIRVFRWAGWLAGVALSLFWLINTHASMNPHAVFSWWFVNGFFVFQLGLSFPESWLKSERARINVSAANDGSATVS
jgi:hypothetical protein